ncbi:MAG: T9SS type A sorting domain-containing protein, partial [Ignavibacteriales bacterium]|nr:T9SS type A sorting domain-containing protein [Ignavibacteriales bacterium]
IFPVSSFARSVGASNTDNSPQWFDNGVFVSKGDSLFVFFADGRSKTLNGSGFLSTGAGNFLPTFDAAGPYVIGVKDSVVSIAKLIDANADSVYESVTAATLNLHKKIIAPPVVDKFLVLAAEDGTLNYVDIKTAAVASVWKPSNESARMVTVVRAASGTNPIIALTPSAIYNDLAGSSYSFGHPVSGYAVSGSAFVAVLDTLNGDCYYFSQSLSFMRRVSIKPWLGNASAPIVLDLDLDGSEDVVFTCGNKIIALNTNGVMLDGFPATLQSGSGGPMAASAQLLAADLNNDQQYELVAVLENGVLNVISSRGKILTEFSSAILDASNTTPALLQNLAGGNLLLVCSAPSGAVKAWQIANPGTSSLLAWPQRFRDAQHSSASKKFQGITAPISSENFPKTRAYNWPNPVYGNSTQIRFYVARDANVTIRIYDVAGTKVTELYGTGVGGSDNEMTWDVTGIQTGIYLARIEASGSGFADAAVVKIAVVK